ncbi:MAG TPA: metalloregulator ArsR/SmtB family transcription factor [Candidatus Dojkabacteria bacterium]|nr:metalloregulator ArsR/SmtB family transcription factor [Candidatus Dojkabacteria bacterium]
MLNAIADPNRVKVLRILADKRICVIDLAQELGISHNLLSFHLKKLVKAGILNKERSGNCYYYFITKHWEERINHLLKFLNI